jgi:hypothetical protein
MESHGESQLFNVATGQMDSHELLDLSHQLLRISTEHQECMQNLSGCSPRLKQVRCAR